MANDSERGPRGYPGDEGQRGQQGDRGERGLTLPMAGTWVTLIGGLFTGLTILIGGVFWAGGRADAILSTLNANTAKIDKLSAFVREDHENIQSLANAVHIILPADTKTTDP